MMFFGGMVIAVLLLFTVLTGMHVIKATISVHKTLAWTVLILGLLHASFGALNYFLS